VCHDAAVVGERLTEYLLDAGATTADIDEAERNGWLPVLVLDRMLMPGAGRYDIDGLASASSVDATALRRLWRALGFPDIPAGLALFSDNDVAAVRILIGRFDPEGVLPDPSREPPERQARVVSAAFARIAAYEAEQFATLLEEFRTAGMSDEDISLALIDHIDLDGLAWLLDYAHRLQLRAAAWRRLTDATPGSSTELGVGFVDLSGYTELSEALDDQALAGLLDTFEGVVFDTVAARSGRVVKTIGDEIMFVGPPDAVCTIALEILARARATEELPSVRIGLGFGAMLARDGDYFGPAVNLASRITDRARPGTVLASESLHDILDNDASFEWRVLAPRRIRGIGLVRLFALRGRGALPPAP
jgi:adenylate cyclase